MPAPKNPNLKWRADDVKKLLKHYKKLNILWDSRLYDYKEREKKEEAYKLLKNKLSLNITVRELKNKIKGLRTSYSEELNKIIDSQQAGEKIYKPKLFWFKLADSFLRDVTERRKPILNNLEEVYDEDDSSTQSDEAKITIENPVNNSPKCANPPSITPAEKEEQEIIEHAIDLSEKLEASQENERQTRLENENQEDEFDLFGRSLALQLKKFPEINALELMQEIQLLVNSKRRQLDKVEINLKSSISNNNVDNNDRDGNTFTALNAPITGFNFVNTVENVNPMANYLQPLPFIIRGVQTAETHGNTNYVLLTQDNYEQGFGNQGTNGSFLPMDPLASKRMKLEHTFY